MKTFLLFLFCFSAILPLELFSLNKVQSYDGTKVRFKYYSNEETSNDVVSSKQKFGQTYYQFSREVAQKLKFLNFYRNLLKKDQIIVNDKGDELIEKGKLYINLKDKINLDLIDNLSSKRYSISFANAALDEIFRKNGGIRIVEFVKLRELKSTVSISPDAMNIRSELLKTYILEFDESIDIIQFCIDLAAHPLVNYAEPIPINRTSTVPNDTYYSSQFALSLMQCPQAWDIFKGENASEEIIIGVCDSGVDWDHPDLLNNLKHNLGEDANNNGYVVYYDGANWVIDPGDINNIDDDFNGFADDFIGWNFFTDDASLSYNPMAVSPNTHGTHVAGICNATTNNSQGVAGLPWNLKFLPTKHGDNSDGRSIYSGYDGIVFLAEQGADIINCSWGGGAYSASDQTAINYAYSLGSIIVAAAGNDNSYFYHYPSSYQNVVSVSSVNEEKVKADYSNYGISIDVSAYGGETSSDGGILSTVPNNSYDLYQGTSMASPYVAALASYYKAYKPNSSNYDIIKAILGSSTNVNDYNPGYERTLGHGIINAYNAITMTNPDISHIPYMDLLWIAYIEPSGNGQINNDETIDWEFAIKNFNHLYGTSNFKYFITTTDPDVTILNGTGTTTLGADSYLNLNNVKFQISQNCPNKIVKFDIKFDIDNGYEYNYISSILILNSDSQAEAYAYIAYDPTSNLKGPCKFKINNPNNLTVLEDQSTLEWVKAGTYFNNQWYGFDNSNKLITINPTDGSRTLVKQFNNPISGLAYDFLSRKFYGILESNSLYSLDIPNGNLIDFYNVSNFYVNLAADKQGNLYSIELSNNSLFKIGRYAENQQYVCGFNYDLNYAQDIECDNNSDILFASLFTNDNQSIFAAIDKELGFTFEINNMPNNYEITGLAFPSTWNYSGIKLNSPDYNENDIEKNHVFSWDNFQNATDYTIEFSLNENFSNIYYQTSSNTNSVQLPNQTLTLGFRYFWRVSAFNNDVEIGKSPIWTFVAVMPNYCVASSNNCDEYIGTLIFSNINNVSYCNNYSNYLNIIGEVRQNRTYSIYINNPVPYEGDAVGVFIDWNQNDVFDSPSEYYLLSTLNHKDYYAEITVPENATLGTTVMRARIVYDETLSPCGISDYGEVEDYSINVLEKLDEQDIALKQGWNLISTYIIPLSANMVNIWNSISQSLLIVKNNQGNVYIPSYGINNIGNWVLNQGYLAYMSTANTLTIQGNSCNPQNENMNFINGWNTLAYLRNSEMNVVMAFADLVAQEALLIAKNLAGQAYIPSFGINNIGNLVPGQGYKMYCTKSGTFKFPSN